MLITIFKHKDVSNKTSLIIKMFTNIFDHKNVFESIYPAFEKIE